MDSIQTFVVTWFGNWWTVLAYFGWLPILLLLIAIRLFAMTAARVKIHRYLLPLIALWATGVVYIGLMRVVTSSFFWDSFSDYEAVVVAWVKSQAAYQWLDGWLAPTTDFVLLFGSLIAIPFTRESQSSRAKLFTTAIGIWFFISIVICLYLAIAGLVRHPLLAIVYLGFGLALLGFDASSKSTLKYSSEYLLRGFKIRRIQETGLKGDPVRIALILLVVAAFWFRLSITDAVLINFYSTAIAGLLAIMGFAALVFTFAYEVIPTMRLKREVAEDTRSVQRSATTVVVASVCGLLLTNGPIVLAPDTNLLTMLRVGIFVCAFAGLLIATDTVMTLFRHLVRVLADLGNFNAALNVYFEESRTPDANSVTSETTVGLSELRGFLEERGCNVIPLSLAPWESLQY